MVKAVGALELGETHIVYFAISSDVVIYLLLSQITFLSWNSSIFVWILVTTSSIFVYVCQCDFFLSYFCLELFCVNCYIFLETFRVFVLWWGHDYNGQSPLQNEPMATLACTSAWAADRPKKQYERGTQHLYLKHWTDCRVFSFVGNHYQNHLPIDSWCQNKEIHCCHLGDDGRGPQGLEHSGQSVALKV